MQHIFHIEWILTTIILIVTSSSAFPAELRYQITSDSTAMVIKPSAPYYSDHIIVPEKYREYIVTEIGSSAFSAIYSAPFNKYVGPTSVTLPNSIIKIKSGAFYQNKDLRTVDLGKGVKEIEGSAFTNCKELRSLTIPGSVELFEIKWNGEYMLDGTNVSSLTFEYGESELKWSKSKSNNKEYGMFIFKTDGKYWVPGNVFINRDILFSVYGYNKITFGNKVISVH